MVVCPSGNFTGGNIMEKRERISMKGPSSFGGKFEHTLPVKLNKQGTSTRQQVSFSCCLQANYQVLEPSFGYIHWFYPKYTRSPTPQHCSKVDFCLRCVLGADRASLADTTDSPSCSPSRFPGAFLKTPQHDVCADLKKRSSP